MLYDIVYYTTLLLFAVTAFFTGMFLGVWAYVKVFKPGRPVMKAIDPPKTRPLYDVTVTGFKDLKSKIKFFKEIYPEKPSNIFLKTEAPYTFRACTLQSSKIIEDLLKKYGHSYVICHFHEKV